MSQVTPPIAKVTGTVSRRSSTINQKKPLQFISFTVTNTQDATSGSTKLELPAITIRNHTTSSQHRPALPKSQHVTHHPLMQGFRTSTPRPIFHYDNPIDFVFLPYIKQKPLSSMAVRMPLSPDNFAPVRSIGSGSEAEALDGLKGRIVAAIVAARPEQVVAASTAVVGNDGLATANHVTINFLPIEQEALELSRIRRIREGLVGDMKAKMFKFD